MESYRIQLQTYSYKPEFQQSKLHDALQFEVRCEANSRLEALQHALPRLATQKHMLAGKYLSVFVGTSQASRRAARLIPIQVTIETMEIRRLKSDSTSQ